MKTALVAIVISAVCTLPALAADNTSGSRRGQGQGDHLQGLTVAQKKAEILAHIDQRIANSQAERACVQAAASHDDMRACREKYRPPRPDNMGQQGQDRDRPPRRGQQQM